MRPSTSPSAWNPSASLARQIDLVPRRKAFSGGCVALRIIAIEIVNSFLRMLRVLPRNTLMNVVIWAECGDVGCIRIRKTSKIERKVLRDAVIQYSYLHIDTDYRFRLIL